MTIAKIAKNSIEKVPVAVVIIKNQNDISIRLKKLVQPEDMIITMGAGNIWRQCKTIYQTINSIPCCCNVLL